MRLDFEFYMNVIHVITGLSDGGAEGVLYRLVVNDDANVHHVISLSSVGKYGSLLRDVGIKVTTLEMPRGRLTFSGCFRLWRILRYSRPNVIQTWMYHADLLGGFFGWLMGIPVVWGVRNSTLVVGKSTRSTIWVSRVCAAVSSWVPQQIIVCAQEAARVHSDIGYDRDRLVFVPNGYDLSKFSPNLNRRAEMRGIWGVSGPVPIIGMVARFDPFKEHISFIRALVRLKRQGIKFRAVLIGSGVDANNKRLVDEIEAGGLADIVRLLGVVDDIPSAMNAIDLHVLSSSAEAFPNVLAEAMSCGTPCVATNVGDAASILGDTGWIVAPNDVNALADGIAAALACMAQGSTWNDRRLRCRKKISNEYSLENMISCYRKIWGEAVKRGSHRSKSNDP